MEDLKVEKDDQAKELRAILNELNGQSEEKQPSPTDNVMTVIEEDNVDLELVDNNKMNVLNLPPRSVVHGYDKNRVRFKISKPLLRFLTVSIILILILGVYIFWVAR